MVVDNQTDSTQLKLYGEYCDIKLIASPLFALRVNLAREEGLLELILAGDLEGVRIRASQCLAARAAGIRWAYPPTQDEFSMLALEILSESEGIVRHFEPSDMASLSDAPSVKKPIPIVGDLE